MLTDVDLPANIRIDKDSLYSMFGAHHGNVFCAVMSLPDGVIYTAPYTHAANRPAWTPQSVGGNTEYSHQARCAGRDIPKMYHQENGIPGHEQLAVWLAQAGVAPAQGFVGFTVEFANTKGGMGTTSRSQNNQHFRERLGNLGASNPNVLERFVPNGNRSFHEQTRPGDGVLPPTWAEAIKRALQKNLGRDYITSSEVKISNPPAAVNVPIAPPPPKL